MADPPGEAALKGSAIHDDIDAWFKDKKKPTTSFRKATHHLELLTQEKGLLESEYKLAVNREWAVVDWYAPDAWIRAILDLMIYNPEVKNLIVQDHKTGKRKESHEDQLELYAVIASHAVDVYAVDTRIFYTRWPDEPTRRVYSLGDIVKLKEKWQDRIEFMEKDSHFIPNPGSHCTYCPFRRSNGGPCIYG